MKAKGFKLELVVNPETGEETQRIMVATDEGKDIKLFAPNWGETIEEKVAHIKANREKILAQGFNLIQGGEFGPYCMPKAAVLIEAF